MATNQQNLGVTTVNKATLQGITRILEVRLFDDNNVSINLTIFGDKNIETCKMIKLNRRETLSLIFFLVAKLLPFKFLVNKTRKKREKKEEKKKEMLLF